MMDDPFQQERLFPKQAIQRYVSQQQEGTAWDTFFSANETQQSHQEQEIIVSPQKSQIVFIMALFTFNLLLQLFNTIQSLTHHFDNPLFWLVLISINLLLYSCIVWDFGRAIFSRKPALRINREGIFVAGVYYQPGYFLPWSEISHLSIKTVMLSKMLCIRLKDPALTYARFSVWQRLRCRINKGLGSEDIAIAQLNVKMPLEEIVWWTHHMYLNELTHYEVSLSG